MGLICIRIANTENDVLSDIKQMLLKGLRPNQKYISLDDMGLDRDQDDLCLSDLGTLLVHAVSEKRSKIITEGLEVPVNGKSLPKVITFPYARHSSYSELCNLVKVFNPKDIYPCTVDEYNWHEGMLHPVEVILSEVELSPWPLFDSTIFLVTWPTRDTRSQRKTSVWAALLFYYVSSR